MNIATAAPERLRLALCGLAAACALALAGLAAPASAMADQISVTWQQGGQQQSATYSDAESMESAVAALPSDASDVTVRLDSDVTTSSQWELSRDLLLDLNGHAWTFDATKLDASSDTLLSVMSGANLTVTDSSESQTGSLSYEDENQADDILIQVDTDATLCVEKGSLSVDTDNNPTAPFVVYSYGTVEVNGGHLTGVLSSLGGRLAIHGGALKGAAQATTVQVNGGSFAMDGGSVNGLANDAVAVDINPENGDTAKFLGGKVSAEAKGHAGINVGLTNKKGDGAIIIGGRAQVASENGPAVWVIEDWDLHLIEIDDSAQLSGGSNCIKVESISDNGWGTKMAVNGGYFKYGTSFCNPNSSIVSYPAGKLLSSTAITEGDYAGFYTLTDSEAVDKSALDAALVKTTAIYEKGNTDRAYPTPKWRAFTAAYESAKTGASNSNANQAETDALTKALEDAYSELQSDVEKIADGFYKIQVAAYNADGSGNLSASAPALEPDAYLTVEDGKGTLVITYKPLYIFGLWGAMRQLWVYKGDTLSACQSAVKAGGPLTEGTYLTRYSYDGAYDGSYNSRQTAGTGTILPYDESDSCPGVVRIQLPYLNDESDQVYAKVRVDAMGNSQPAVILHIDYDTIESAKNASDSEVRSLQSLVTRAESLPSANYTDASNEALASALYRAQCVLARGAYEFEDYTAAENNLDSAISDMTEKPEQSISVKGSFSKTYGDKAFSLGAKATGKLTYKSSNKKVATVDKNGTVTVKGVGTAKITVAAAATSTYKAASKTVTVKVVKAKQALKVKASAKTLKAKSLKKKAKAVKAITVKGAKGKLSYKKANGSSKLSVNVKTGKVTVKKGTKKGTYTAKVKVTAKATANYKAASKTVTVKVKVK